MRSAIGPTAIKILRVEDAESEIIEANLVVTERTA
jgi:hypothetical protein